MSRSPANATATPATDGFQSLRSYARTFPVLWESHAQARTAAIPIQALDLAGVDAVVDVDGGAVDVCGAGAAEPQDGCGNFFWFAGACGVRSAHDVVDARLGQLVEHAGFGGAGCDGVDQNAVRAEIECPCFGHVQDSGFGDAVPEIGVPGV